MADGTISDLTDAKDYVDSVIQKPLFVNCTNESKCYARKRHLSESNLLDDSDVCVKSRRVVQGKKSSIGSPGSEDSVNAADNSVLLEDFSSLFKKLSEEIASLNNNMNDRIDQLEVKICHKIGNMIDKRINAEAKKISAYVNRQINSFTDEIRQEIAHRRKSAKDFRGCRT